MKEEEQVSGGTEPPVRTVQRAGSEGEVSPSGVRTATTESRICKQPETRQEEDYDDEGDDVCSSGDDVKTEARDENEEQIKEYLNRSDTAVIFPEPVSLFGLKDSLKNEDPDQDSGNRRSDGEQEMRSKVTGSASEYLIC